MSYLQDPRVYFAAERTLLAWVRTANTVMGLGFVVARFGMFLAYIGHGQDDGYKQPLALGIGIAFVLLGSTACIIASIQFRRFLANLSEAERPPRYLMGLGPWSAYVVATLGVLLSLYLVM